MVASAIVFDCNRGCKAVLSADLGSKQDFGPCETEFDAQQHARRRREYVGEQVEVALLTHLLFDCPMMTDDACCVICSSPIETGDDNADVCDTCTKRVPFTIPRPEAGQQ